MVEHEKAGDEELRATGKHPIAKRALIATAIAIVALIGFFAWFVNDYYHADAIATLAKECDRSGNPVTSAWQNA